MGMRIISKYLGSKIDKIFHSRWDLKSVKRDSDLYESATGIIDMSGEYAQFMRLCRSRRELFQLKKNEICYRKGMSSDIQHCINKMGV